MSDNFLKKIQEDLKTYDESVSNRIYSDFKNEQGKISRLRNSGKAMKLRVRKRKARKWKRKPYSAMREEVTERRFVAMMIANKVKKNS